MRAEITSGGDRTDDHDLHHLRRCVELATEALEAGDEPFGSLLVAADGTVLAEDHNRGLRRPDPRRSSSWPAGRPRT